jgi:drug/metabolite transporter (DMT)-like permease
VSAASAALLAIGMALHGESFVIPDRRSLLSLLVLGIFSQGVGWILISNALPRLRVSLSGLILLLQPALAFVWDVTFFGRPTNAANWIGVTIVLVAIYMGSTRERTGGRTG